MREVMLPKLQNPGKILELVQKGAVYAYGRDKQMSPIIVINIRRAFNLGFSAEDIFQANEFI